MTNIPGDQQLRTDDVLRLLRAHGSITTEQAAAQLGHPVQRVATRLSRLALYGKIDRTHERYVRADGRTQRRSQWSAKRD